MHIFCRLLLILPASECPSAQLLCQAKSRFCSGGSPLTSWRLSGQMVEELVMATMMSVVFSLPTWYLCQLKGSIIIWWLAWLVSLADGIGAGPLYVVLFAMQPHLFWTSCHSLDISSAHSQGRLLLLHV